MLLYRVITAALLAIALLVLLFGLPKTLFVSSLLFILFAATWEWSNLAGYNYTSSKIAFIGVFLILAFCAVFWLDFNHSFNGDRAFLSLIFLVTIIFFSVVLIFSSQKFKHLVLNSLPFVSVMGMSVFLALWIAILTVISFENGRFLLLFGILIVVLSDVGGYVVGKLFGSNKLAPQISPGKTWEGLAGSCFFSLGLLFFLGQTNQVFFNAAIAGNQAVIIFFLMMPIVIVSVIGDLFISVIKRFSGVKDTGHILPGHGGMLDRIDGLMLAIPVFALLISMLGFS
tara:strand:- start:1023 stop:1877 length:855 start_codon:yes stop_codon:yes gene_type:complete